MSKTPQSFTPQVLTPLGCQNGKVAKIEKNLKIIEMISIIDDRFLNQKIKPDSINLLNRHDFYLIMRTIVMPNTFHTMFLFKTTKNFRLKTS